MTIPTPHQVGRIVTAAEEWFRPFIGSCAFAGLRLGEAAAVKIDDIDFMRRTLTVSRQVQRRAGHSLEIRAPKYNSERVIYLPDDLVTMLSEYVRNFGVRPQGWLFVGMDGAPPHSNTIGRWWRRALRTRAYSRRRPTRRRANGSPLLSICMTCGTSTPAG